MSVKILGRFITLLVMLCIILPSCAQNPPPEATIIVSSDNLTLEGKSFPGRIKAKGIMGLFGVKGTLTFEDGFVTWLVKGKEETAPYKVEESEGILKFTAQMRADNGTYVDWSGAYNGQSLSNVNAIWTRTNENDFIHDLFLPDVVTFVFTQEQD